LRGQHACDWSPSPPSPLMCSQVSEADRDPKNEGEHVPLLAYEEYEVTTG
jgi:hypothetical protein